MQPNSANADGSSVEGITVEGITVEGMSEVRVEPAPFRDRTWGDQNWATRAACKGKAELFFPPYAERPQARVKREAKAMAICAGCPVRVPCLWWGRQHHEYGIWGGENEEGRVRAGYTLMAPIGTRHLARERRNRPTPMPLAEIIEPTAEELAEIERWMTAQGLDAPA
jgi:WhiB family redox-sensing transcriptional regulator